MTKQNILRFPRPYAKGEEIGNNKETAFLTCGDCMENSFKLGQSLNVNNKQEVNWVAVCCNCGKCLFL